MKCMNSLDCFCDADGITVNTIKSKGLAVAKAHLLVRGSYTMSMHE